MPSSLRRLSYHPLVIRTVRALGLRAPARRLYHRWAAPRQGILRVGQASASAAFVTRTAEQLRAVEAGSRESSLQVLAEFLRPGDVVYDVGSHLGLYGVLLARVVGSTGVVVAFEPHRETYQQLLENLKLNQLTNVRAYQKAVGEQTGSMKLYLGGVVANFSLMPSGVEGFVEGKTPFEQVEVVRGDEFVQSAGLPIPRAVKIDVEGFEYSVIKGLESTLAARECELVCCEVHPRFLPPPIEPTTIVELLRSLGYNRIEGQGVDKPYHVVAYKR